VAEATIQTGRRWLTLVPHLLLFGFWTSAVMIEMLFHGSTVYVGFSLLVAAALSVASVVLAVRSGRIPFSWGVAAFALWAVARGTLSYLECFQLVRTPLWMQWHFLFATALVMLPISLPPLAVAWNRRR
jgi:hypothetical protein